MISSGILGKPKIFFFNSCTGDKEDYGIFTVNFLNLNAKNSNSYVTTQDKGVWNIPPGSPRMAKEPENKDMLLAYFAQDMYP